MPECISVVIDEISGIDRPTPCLTYEVLHLTLISQKNHLAGHPRQKQVDGESLKESCGSFLIFHNYWCGMYYAVKKIRSSSKFYVNNVHCPAPTCSRNQYSWSTPDLHTARPPNKFRPQHKTPNDRRTKHPEFRNSGRVFDTLHIWNVLVNDLGTLIEQ